MKWLARVAALLLAVAAGVALYHVVFTIYHGQVTDAGDASNLIGANESSFLYWFAGAGLVAAIAIAMAIPAALRLPDWSLALIPVSVAAQMSVRFYVHTPWLVPSLLAGLSLWLASEIARRLYGDRAASLTLALLAFAPFLLLQSGAAPATVAMLGAVYSCVRQGEAAPHEKRKWVLAAFIAGVVAGALAPTLGFAGVLTVSAKLLRLNYWLLGCPLSLLLVCAAPITSLSTKLTLAWAAIVLAITGPSDFLAAAYLLGILAAAGLDRISRSNSPAIAIVVVNLAMFLPPQIHALRMPPQ